MNLKMESTIYKLLEKQLDSHFNGELNFYSKDNLKNGFQLL